jgi:hypothetical protein
MDANLRSPLKAPIWDTATILREHVELTNFSWPSLLDNTSELLYMQQQNIETLISFKGDAGYIRKRLIMSLL